MLQNRNSKMWRDVISEKRKKIQKQNRYSHKTRSVIKLNIDTSRIFYRTAYDWFHWERELNED